MTLNFEYNGLYKIISGGQTGADIAGLKAAVLFGVDTGGTAPKDFKIQGGFNPSLADFGLMPKGTYVERTRQNVSDSDGTVIFGVDLNSPGSVLTARSVLNAKKPLCTLNIHDFLIMSHSDIVDTSKEFAVSLQDFIVSNKIRVLNVAGNRELRNTGNIIEGITERIVVNALGLLHIDGLLIRKTSDSNHK